jgi:hypothetical protein
MLDLLFQDGSTADQWEGQTAVPAIPKSYGHPPTATKPGSMERAAYWYLMICRCRALRFERKLDTVLETSAIRRSIITDQA